MVNAIASVKRTQIRYRFPGDWRQRLNAGASVSSGLVRDGRDWHPLIELCGWVRVLLNDGLLLGLKGTTSEFELNLVRRRARKRFARKPRAELQVALAVGDRRAPNGSRRTDAEIATIRNRIDQFDATGLAAFCETGPGNLVLNSVTTTFNPAAGVWTNGNTLSFVATSTSSTLRFTDTSDGAAAAAVNWALDNVTVNGSVSTGTPEPATWSMIGLGGLMLLKFRRQMK